MVVKVNVYRKPWQLVVGVLFAFVLKLTYLLHYSDRKPFLKMEPENK